MYQRKPLVTKSLLWICLGFIVFFTMIFSCSFRDARKSAATPTPAAASAEIGEAPVPQGEPTIAPTPTIPPRLLIRYSQEYAENGQTYEQCLIKGNINSKGDKVYHVPGSPSYDATKIDTKAGERWFCTEYDAIQAGWHAPGQ